MSLWVVFDSSVLEVLPPLPHVTTCFPPTSIDSSLYYIEVFTT